MLADYYEVLRVREDADQAEIEEARRRLLKKYHPDTHPGDLGAEEKTKAINNAYDTLGDPAKRAQYDSDRKAKSDSATSSTVSPPEVDLASVAFGDVTLGSRHSETLTVWSSEAHLGISALSIEPMSDELGAAWNPASDDPSALNVTVTLRCHLRSNVGGRNYSLSIVVGSFSFTIPITFNVIPGDIGFSPDDDGVDEAGSADPVPPTGGTSPLPTPVVAPAGATASRSGIFRGWLVGFAAYWAAGILVSAIGVTLSNTASRSAFLILASLWQLCAGICAGIMTTGAIRRDHRKIANARRAFFVSTAISASIILVMLAVLRPAPVPNTIANQGAGTSALVAPSKAQNQNVAARLLNASYPSGCFKVFSGVGFGQAISIRNGEWDNGGTDPVNHAYFGIDSKKILLADLTGDGRQMAVVHTDCGIYASTETYSEVFVIDTMSPDLNVLSRLSPEDWGDSLGQAWNTSGVKVESGLIVVSFPLGGSHAQPDWDATTAFKWDGNRFARWGFEAHGRPDGSHPNEIARDGADLSFLHLGAALNTQSSSAADNTKGQSTSNDSSTQITQGASDSSPGTVTPQGASSVSQHSAGSLTTLKPKEVTPQDWLAFAEYEFEQNHYSTAMLDCNAVLQRDPHNLDALQLKDKIAKAMSILGVSTATQSSGAPPTVTPQEWLAVAEMQYEHNRYDAALEDCNAALQLDPGNNRALQLKEKIQATVRVLGRSE